MRNRVGDMFMAVSSTVCGYQTKLFRHINNVNFGLVLIIMSENLSETYYSVKLMDHTN